jgi:N-acetylmuramoyl-L-alanine amidase
MTFSSPFPSVEYLRSHIGAFVCSVALCALHVLSDAAAKPPALQITYPPPRSVTRFMQTRIAGSCDPASKVFIQNKAVKVYSTGAFVGLVPLVEGENTIEVLARKGSEKESRRLIVTCRDPLVTSPSSPLTIDEKMTEPAVDTVLCAGDELHVQLKGSPGMKASWSLGDLVRNAPLKETAPAKEGLLKGIRGIYTGSYKIEAGDRVEKKRVRFTLSSGKRKAISAFASGLVTLIPKEELARGRVGADGAILRVELDGDRAWKLDAGTRVDICGEAGDYYRLKLSNGERYWTEKEGVKSLKGKGGWGMVNVGEPSLGPTEGGALFSVPLSGKAPYRVTQPAGKNALVLELFGAAPPRQKIDLKGAAPVTAVEFPGPQSDTVKIVLRLAGRVQWGYVCRRTNVGLTLEIKKSPGKKIGKLAVVIDPGHGGKQSGAVSPTGLLEKDLNLPVALALADYLEGRGARVILTRNSDKTLSLAGRIEKARGEQADIFVSIHHDSRAGQCDPLERRGAAVYYGVPQSRRLAERILKRLSKMGLKSNGCKRRDYAVVLPADYPAVLVECAYMSHPKDEELLLRKKFLSELGGAIGRGIAEYVEKM